MKKCADSYKKISVFSNDFHHSRFKNICAIKKKKHSIYLKFWAGSKIRTKELWPIFLAVLGQGLGRSDNQMSVGQGSYPIFYKSFLDRFW